MKKMFTQTRRIFPSPELTTPEGLIAVSDIITTEALLEAYSFGIYPWPMEESPMLWFSPPERGVIEFADFHAPRSLQKWMRQEKLEFTWNTRFTDVIESCKQAPRPGQGGTWITEGLRRAYIEFHREGYAHSLECWSGGELIGGMYGVYVAGVFCGESMFYKKSNASKACLVYSVDFLGKRGLTWMDTQMLSPTVEAMGGRAIPRAEFLARLEDAKRDVRPLF